MIFVSMVSEEYAKKDPFWEHAFGGVFFTGGHAAYGFDFEPSREQFVQYVKRQDAEGNLTRRAQKNNVTSLYGSVWTVDKTINYRFQELFADLSPQVAVDRITGCMRKAILEVKQAKPPIEAMARRGAGGKILIPARETNPHVIHFVAADGSFNAHDHELSNGVVEPVPPDGRFGTQANNEAHYFLARWKNALFQERLVEAMRVYPEWKSVRLVNGRAVDPTVTPEMVKASGIGTRRQKILAWLAEKNLLPTRLNTLLANKKTRDRKAKIYHLEERSRVWKEGILRARALGQKATQQRKFSDTPGVSRVARAFRKAAKVGRWLYARWREIGQETFLLDTTEQLDRFMWDTGRKPFWFGMLAARRAIRRVRFKRLKYCLEVAESAHKKAVRPSFVPDKKITFRFSKDLVQAMDARDAKRLLALRKKTGCTLKAEGMTDQEFEGHLRKTLKRDQRRVRRKRNQSRGRQY